jgi:outer membrane immunogenic protein
LNERNGAAKHRGGGSKVNNTLQTTKVRLPLHPDLLHNRYSPERLPVILFARNSILISVKENIMRKLIAAAAFIALGSTSVLAADLAARPYTKAAPVMVDPIYNWSGFYIGINGGGAWAQNDHSDLNLPLGGFFTFGPDGAFGGRQRVNANGGIFGGQAGYNWQMSNWVFGVELAGDGTNIRRTDVSIFFPPAEFLTSKVDGIFTATGRIGYAFNNWLPYIKGGYAGAQLRTTNFTTGGASLDHSDWRGGYTIGAGLEYGITPNWTVGVEYAYMDFGNRSWNGTTIGPLTPESFNDSLRISTITGRLNYRFGGPVVARY